jgi:hypothetical protein
VPVKALLASLAIVAFIQTASPVMAAPAHTFYVLSENRSPRPRAVWSAWRSPGELVWSMATDCQLRNSVALSSGEAIVTAHCPVSTEWKGRKAYVYKPIAIKLDTAGHPIWSKRLDIEGFTELYGLRPAPNGTFFASGVRELCAGSDACRESFFVNFNSAGQMIQAKLLKSKDDDKASGLMSFA